MNDVATIHENGGWQAELDLRIGVSPALGDGISRLLERRHRGPLVVQRPFHPEGGPCHLYIVHPPGGVVGGDELRVGVTVEPGAHALITTPAATKFYRCEARPSSQTQEIRAAGATVEWLPQENIFHRGADVRAATRVQLDEHSRFIGWEIACPGLPARAEPFDTGMLRLDFEVWRERGTVPLFIDRLRLSGTSPARTARSGFAGQEAFGTLLATPATAAHVERVRELIAGMPLASASLVDGVLVLRALGPQAEPVRRLFIDAWTRLRPEIIGRVAVPPRIWNT
jgi:urease accessory protein